MPKDKVSKAERKTAKRRATPSPTKAEHKRGVGAGETRAHTPSKASRPQSAKLTEQNPKRKAY